MAPRFAGVLGRWLTRKEPAEQFAKRRAPEQAELMGGVLHDHGLGVRQRGGDLLGVRDRRADVEVADDHKDGD